MTGEDIRHHEALRRYQLAVAIYEKQVIEYKQKLALLVEGDIKPSRPIPPVPPLKPVKFDFPEGSIPPPDPTKDSFNEGVEAAAHALEIVGEREMAEWVRKQRK